MSNGSGKNGGGWDADRTNPVHDVVRYQDRDDGKLIEAYRVQAFQKGARSTNVPPFGPNDRREVMIPPIERRIAVLRERLADTQGFDPKTGQPVYLLQGTQREAAQRELHQLESYTLPMTLQIAEAAEKWHAENTPTTEQKLLQEKERNERLDARAAELKFEQDAKIRALVRKAEESDE